MKLIQAKTSRTMSAAVSVLAILSLTTGTLAASPEHCNRFSKMVEKQMKVNKSKNCGFSGPLWDGDVEEQYRRCLATNVKKVNADIIMRKKMLDSCK